mgnify:CR=1 FL=1
MQTRRTIFDTPFVTVLARLWARVFFWCIGWQPEGEAPRVRCVMIAAPHTSNWDLPIMLACAFLLRAKLFWMTKAEVFRIPLFGRFLKWLGGIPIDRSRPNGVVGQCVELLKAHKDLILAVPPEGTRKKVKAWKTGFYHIALGAGVPIALGYLDYGRRRGGVMGFFHPTGDYEADVRAIQERYRHITPKYPELSSLADEAEKD